MISKRNDNAKGWIPNEEQVFRKDVLGNFDNPGKNKFFEVKDKDFDDFIIYVKQIADITPSST